jgi:N-acetylglucosaminyldiphosphoundecaprenol N-acetyl-beta-D-mannosaminyltransferase
MPPAQVQILNGRFDKLSADQTVEELMRTIRAGERGILSTVNVAILMMMRSNPRLQRFVDSSRWIVADGQPLVWASHLRQQPLPERVAGIDLIDQLCARAVQEGVGVYFLGAESSTVREAVNVLQDRHRGLDVRGYADGYFGPEQAEARARVVAESGAALLFVAMGVPRQEYFIEEQWKISARRSLSVSAAASTSSRACAGERPSSSSARGSNGPIVSSRSRGGCSGAIWSRTPSSSA